YAKWLDLVTAFIQQLRPNEEQKFHHIPFLSVKSWFFSFISTFCFCHQLELKSRSPTIRIIPIIIKIMLKIYGTRPAVSDKTVEIRPGGSLQPPKLGTYKAIARCIIPNKIVPDINKTYPKYLIFLLISHPH